MKKLKRIYNPVLMVILALAIVLGSSAAMITADDNTSLQEQINNAENVSTITLTKDYNESITIPAGKEITLDLNGHTLTSPGNTVITNNGTLTVKDSAGTGKIEKIAQEGDTFGITNNGTLTFTGGSIEIKTVVRGIAHGINNPDSGVLTVSGGSIYSVTTGENWAFGIFNRGRIVEISGGFIKGQIDRRTGNGFNALGISNESVATIDLISGGTIAAEVNNDGRAWGIRNRGLIKEISGGLITAKTTGTVWAFGLWNTENGHINKISGGTFSGYIDNPSNGNNGLGISNHENGTPVIDLITGGVFIGQTNGSGSGFGLRSDGIVNKITGGAYKGNNAENALLRRAGTMNIEAGYELKDGTFFRYVMPSDGFFVELVDEQEKWLATYTYNSAGEVTSALGDGVKDKYTVFNWNKSSEEKTIECDAEDFGAIKANTTLYVKTQDKPVYYFLGSSVTLGHTTNGISFVDYLAEDNGWITVKKAVSGTTLVDSGSNSYIQRMINQIGVNAGIDNFICQLSTNDATQNKPLGTISASKNKNDFDKTTIIGAIEYIIAYAYETWDCPVTFYTNPRFNNSLYEQMIDALYQLQKKWGIGIIDFYNYRNMEPLSQATLNSYMSDPIHPNENGYRWMAQEMSRLLQQIENPQEPGTSPEPEEPGTSPEPEEPDTTVEPEPNTGTGDATLAIMLALLCGSGSLAFLLMERKKNYNK